MNFFRKLAEVNVVFPRLRRKYQQIVNVHCTLQHLCHMQLHWDDTIPGKLNDQWNKFIQVITQLRDVRLQCCLNPFPTVDEVELHAFSDAARLGMEQCATYL